MKLKDIVNRDIVNLTNCDQEPIHIPGSIQPHGYLIALKKNSLLIDFCSENITSLVDLPLQQILGATSESFLEKSEYEKLNTAIKKHPESAIPVFSILIKKKIFHCATHLSGDHYIVEFEEESEKEKQFVEVYDQTREFLAYMQETRSLQELCRMVTSGIRNLTGYDRVMVYRFDKNYNGEVFAESKREDLESFFGLHYPHTDIPPQARELYLRNLLRIIVDVNYKPVPVFTIDDLAGKNLDLSLSFLRSTSPVHVQYLHNIGVGATLTISLIHRGKLWGLIACHHYSPKNISFKTRIAAQLQGHFITSQIEVRQLNEEYEISKKCNEALDASLQLINLRDFKDPDTIIDFPGLTELCNAGGVAILIDGKLFKQGITPSDDELVTLVNYLSTYSKNSNFHSSEISSIIPAAKKYSSVTAGVIYHSLALENENCIIWLRPETVMEVNWAGDPNNAFIKNKEGLSPRNSFKLWKQEVKDKSSEWLNPELNAASAFANALQKNINLVALANEEQKYRRLAGVLKETNSELENINWISTHDLQEPLRKIQLMASRILTEDKSSATGDVKNFVERINSSANRMQSLLKDILKYTRLNYSSETFVNINLNATVNEIVNELAEVIHEKQIEIKIDPLPSIKGIPFLIKQLFLNLFYNSIKFALKDTPLRITIKSSETKENFLKTDRQQHYFHLTFSDNGIGFDAKHAENIFNVFTRLHSADIYEGTGIGLALCRKIMKSHHGTIKAEGADQKGATFHLFFPVDA